MSALAAEKLAVVKNRLGIHARPATLLVQAAAKFTADIFLSKGDTRRINGKSIMGVMMLAAEHLESERATLIENNVRFVQIGRREGLPPEVLDGLDGMIAATAHCTGLTLVLALNYGSRNEIVDAVQTIAQQVAAGQITADQIDEQRISDHLGTAGIVDPDLLIRTAGEMRLSNFLLWQISYAELHVTPTLWPDFDVEQLHRAIRDFASRKRRFGGLSTGNSAK